MAVEIVASPGSTRRVDAVKYEAMRAVMLRVLPRNALGLTARELRDKMLPQLSQDLWPNGGKAGWWHKGVQLDLEAKGLLQRDETSKPLRCCRSK
ncbi:MAG: hypothetical protein ABIS07_09520 [Dokdonella sp.]